MTGMPTSVALVFVAAAALCGAAATAIFLNDRALADWTCTERVVVEREEPAHCAAWDQDMNCTFWVPEDHYQESVCVAMRREAK